MPGKNGGGIAITETALGERVRAARKALGLSQAQLAGEELTKGFISQLESGSVRPSIRSLQVIAARLGKPLDHFLGDEVLSIEKRIEFHRLAAEAAVERRDWDVVRAEADQGLADATGRVDRARFLAFRARAAHDEREFERMFDLINEALSLVDVAADAALVADLTFLRGVAYLELGQTVAATESYETARDIVERNEIPDPRLRSRILVELGAAYRRLKRTSKAIHAYELALTSATRRSELRIAAVGYMGMAAAHYDSGELDTAIVSYQRALTLFQRMADIDLELNAMQSIAIVQFENGDIDRARESAMAALQRAHEVDDRRWSAVVEVILARIALTERKPAAALEMARRAGKVLEEANDKIQLADAIGATAAAYEALGRTAEADRAYRASIDLYTRINDVADRSGMAAEYARVLKDRGQIDEAFAMLELARGGVARR